jgi:hypothetical protein
MASSEGSNIMGGAPRQHGGAKDEHSHGKSSSVHFSSEEPHQIRVVAPEDDDTVDVSRQHHQRQLDSLTDSLAASLQKQRLAHFDYQPFSLPPSRVSFPSSVGYPTISSLFCVLR